MWYMKILYANLVPDFLLRRVIGMFIRRNVRNLEAVEFTQQEDQRRALLEKLDRGPIAIHTHLPNVQHYEVPPAFFKLVLGKRMKYSCGYWQEANCTLDESEERMLDLTCQRAQLEDGMRVLDLGCGWGSLTFWIAEHFPRCQILAVSKSRDQVQFIKTEARKRGFHSIDARQVDVNDLQLDQSFDRIISIEMFEHMKNYRLLLEKISRILRPGGKLFVHIFSHRQFAYEFDAADTRNWMAQTFFTGGTMPSDGLLPHFQGHLRLADHWRFSGMHYARTLRAWLAKMDAQRKSVQGVLAEAYGADQMKAWWVNWRLFFLVCQATWAYRGGREYLVSHYLFELR